MDPEDLTDEELCAAVAEQVFGWDDVATSGEGEPPIGGPVAFGEDPEKGDTLSKDILWMNWRSVGRIVEKMRTKGFGLTMRSPGSFTDEGLGPIDDWQVTFQWETTIDDPISGGELDHHKFGMGRGINPFRAVFEAAVSAIQRRDGSATAAGNHEAADASPHEDEA